MDHDGHRSLIEDLARRVEAGPPGPFGDPRAHFSECWALAKRIGPAFREVRYPTLAQKDGAWRSFQSAMDGLREQQAQRDAEREERSGAARYRLIALADAGSPERLGLFQGIYDSAEGLVGSLVDAAVFLASAGMIRPDPSDPRLETLKALSANHRKAWERFKEERRSLTQEHCQEVYDRLCEVRGELDRAWDDFKDESRQRRDEGRRRREEWRERQESFVGSLKDRLEKQREYLERKREQLSDLEEKRDGARGGAFRERVEGWIAECEEKIEGVEEDIRRLEEKAEEAEYRLSQSA